MVEVEERPPVEGETKLGPWLLSGWKKSSKCSVSTRVVGACCSRNCTKARVKLVFPDAEPPGDSHHNTLG